MSKLSKSQKIQLMCACVLTVLVIIIMPTLSWFALDKEMAVSTKVNSPATLLIKSGGPKGSEQDIINFDLSDIDTQDTSYKNYMSGNTKYYYKDYVFCVKGKAINAYDLQLAHTTNIPFTYQIYSIIQDDTLDAEDPDTIVFQTKTMATPQLYKLARVKSTNGINADISGGDIVYESWTTPLDGGYVNQASGLQRIVADNSLTSRSYGDGDSYQSYANPVYWLKRDIKVYPEEKGDEGFAHSYVLRISWQMASDDEEITNISIVQNNKETDMIYITVAVH